MANEKTLEVILQLKDELSKKLSDSTLKINNFGNEIRSVGKIIAGSFAVKQIYEFAQASLSAYGEQEIALTKLKTALNNSGNSWDNCSNKVNVFLNKIQETTAYSQEETAESLQDIMFYTDDLSAAMEGVKIAEDMASSGMFDLSTASRYVGMAIQGNTETLGRYVSELKESSNENLAFMSASEKSAYALGILKDKFGGMAAGELDTYNGQVKKLGNSMDELKEKVGELIVKWTNLKDVTSFWSDTIDNLLGKSTSNATTGVNQLVTALQAATEKVQELYDAQGNSPEYQMADQNRVAIVTQLQRLINSETSARAYENYGADMASISYEEYQEEFESALDDRIASISDFNDESYIITNSATLKELEDEEWLNQQLEYLDLAGLESLKANAKTETQIEQAKNQAILASTQAMYQYQLTTASNMASIMKSAATISGNSWLDAASSIVNGLSQVILLMLEMKALAAAGELNFWQSAYYVTAIAATVASTAAAIASIQASKKSLNEATVGDVTDSISSAAVGAHVEKGGLLRVHDDEDVVPARVSAYDGSNDVAGSTKIEVNINVNTAMLNSPSNMKEFVSELMDEIDYLTNRKIGRPRTAF